MLHIRLHKTSWFYMIVMLLAWVDFIWDFAIVLINQWGKVDFFLGIFDWTYPPPHFYTPINTLLFGHHVNIVYVNCYYIFLGIVMISIWNKIQEITGYEPVGLLPLKYYEFLLFIVFMVVSAVQTFDPTLWRAYGHMSLVMFLLLLVIGFLRKQAREKKFALFALASQTPATPPAAATKQVSVQTCEICQKESSSPVCPSCERKYQSEIQRVRAQILRAKQAGVAATLTLKEWINTLDAHHWHCVYCHGPFEVMEHYVPIPHGGTTAKNCVPACHRCNLKKSNKHPEKMR